MKPTAIIFDMDGTLCDVSSIRHLVKGDERDFDKFHTESVNCPPHAHVLTAAKQAYADGHHVIVVTARKDRYKHHTSWWLAINEVPAYALKMRASYDNRPDYEVKRDILRELRESYDIIHAWDDNPSVIKLWQEEGIPVTIVPVERKPMKATEFCYWLQGAFELTGLSAFTDGQLKCIGKHLDLVLATDQTGQPSQAVAFCGWLRGGVDFISAEDSKQTLVVQIRLHRCFEHAIDHGYQNKEKLDSIHNPPGSGVTMRC